MSAPADWWRSSLGRLVCSALGHGGWSMVYGVVPGSTRWMCRRCGASTRPLDPGPSTPWEGW